jgi:two-component system, LuxR family, sensor kinase FixL
VRGFLVLDWATFTPAFAPLGITPWNPAIGLALAIVLRRGLAFAPILFIAPLLDDWLVRDLPLPPVLTAIEACLTGVCYSIAVWLLIKSRWRIDPKLGSMRDLLVMLSVTSIAAALVAVAHNLMLSFAGLLPAPTVVAAIFRYLLGEVIGILVVMPFTLLFGLNRRCSKVTIEGCIQACAIVLAIFIVFGFAGQTRLHFSYVLFLPLMWIAVRSGLSGVAAGLIFLQIGIMFALHLTGDQPSHVPAFQALMTVLAIAGLTIGILIDERDRSERYLRRQQEAIARAARVGTLGEVATAVAHELNQPLTAAGNYGRAMMGAMQHDPPDHDLALEAGQKALEQIDRSSQIIRRLRDYIRIGQLEVGAHGIGVLVNECLTLMRADLERLEVRLDVKIPKALPRLAIDPLQIEQVLINLICNAIEAAEAAGVVPEISIAARQRSADDVEITVRDNGRGFPPGFTLGKGKPIESTKVEGLGIGLSLCLSIVESHGGRMTVSTVGRGAVVMLTLPIAKERGND